MDVSLSSTPGTEYVRMCTYVYSSCIEVHVHVCMVWVKRWSRRSLPCLKNGRVVRN